MQWKKLSTSRTGDSPLSTLGHKQAMETGKFLDSWLYENGFTTQDITWLSSPFLRCLETSNDALNSFQKLNVDTLPILPEYSVFEWDGHDGEWHKDLPTLEERKHYFPRLDISHESLFIPTLPEARDKFQQRCQDAIDKLDTRYPFKGGQVLVIVTHAAGCVMLSKVLTKGELHDITPAGPCSIYGFTRTKDAGNVWTLDPHDKPDGFNGYTAHLAEQGSTTVPWNNFGDGKIKFYTGPPTSRFAPSLEEQEEQRKHGQTRTT